LRPETMGHRIEFKHVVPVEKQSDTIPFKEIVLFLPGTQYNLYGVEISKVAIMEEFKTKPIGQDERELLLKLSLGFDHKSQTSNLKDKEKEAVTYYKESLLKFPTLRHLNMAMLRGLKPVTVDTYPSTARYQILRKAYSQVGPKSLGDQIFAVKDFIPTIKKLTAGSRVLHAFCGDGTFTHMLCYNDSSPQLRQHDVEDRRIDKTRFEFQQHYEGADFVILRNVLHKTGMIEVLDDLHDVNVIVIDFDRRKAKWDFEHIHEAGLCCNSLHCEFDFGPHRLFDFDVRIRGGAFGSFLAVRYAQDLHPKVKFKQKFDEESDLASESDTSY